MKRPPKTKTLLALRTRKNPALSGEERGVGLRDFQFGGDTDLALPVKADAQTKAVMTFFVRYRGEGDGHEYALIKRV